MALKDTIKHMRDLLNNITHDLEKSENGNKAASQRVRTGTVKLEKIAKLYRKESIKTEKTTKGTRKPAKKSASKSKKSAVSHSKAKTSSSKKSSASKSKTTKAKPKAKAHKAAARPRALSFKRPTAKLPARSWR